MARHAILLPGALPQHALQPENVQTISWCSQAGLSVKARVTFSHPQGAEQQCDLDGELLWESSYSSFNYASYKSHILLAKLTAIFVAISSRNFLITVHLVAPRNLKFVTEVVDDSPQTEMTEILVQLSVFLLIPLFSGQNDARTHRAS